MDPQWLLLLSLLFWSHSEAKVVQSVWACAQYFHNENPPEIPGVLEGGQIQDQNRYKPILQWYRNRGRFFTLYDTRNKIPVFSAYIFKGNERETQRPNIGWRTEPNKELALINQASNDDYKNSSGYDRGHLYPCSYGHSMEDKMSTFTLTNAVPQAGTFNKGSWMKMERCTKCVMSNYCRDNNNKTRGFLVTGAEPGEKLLNNRVNIPSVMWSAFCCYSSREKKYLASAHWGYNVPDLTKDQYLETKTLNELYSRFSFTLFSPSTCPTDVTVTKFYPKLNAADKSCNCPPTYTTTAPPTTTTAPPTTTQTPTSTTTTTTRKPKNIINREDNVTEKTVKGVKGAVGTMLTLGAGALISKVVKAAMLRPKLTPLLTKLFKYLPFKQSPAEVFPGELTPIELGPVDSAAVDLAPVDPAPVDLAPVELGPVEPAPVDLAPVELAPVDLAPVDLAPVELGPVDLTPVELAPVDLAPVELAPVELAPVELAPFELAPVELAPFELAPVELAAAELAPFEFASIGEALLEFLPLLALDSPADRESDDDGIIQY